MNPFEFFIPQNIIVGAGTLVRLPECAQKLGGTHAMLLSGPTLRKMGIVDKAAKYLEDAGMKGRFYCGAGRRLSNGCCQGRRCNRKIRWQHYRI